MKTKSPPPDAVPPTRLLLLLLLLCIGTGAGYWLYKAEIAPQSFLDDDIAAAKVYETPALTDYLETLWYRLDKSSPIEIKEFSAFATLNNNELAAFSPFRNGSIFPRHIKCWNFQHGALILHDKDGIVDPIDIVEGPESMYVKGDTYRWYLDAQSIDLNAISARMEALFKARRDSPIYNGTEIDYSWEVKPRWLNDIEWLPIEETISPAFTYTYDNEMVEDGKVVATMHRRVIVVIGRDYPVFLTSTRLALAGESKQISTWRELWRDFKFDDGFNYGDRNADMVDDGQNSLNDMLPYHALCYDAWRPN